MTAQQIIGRASAILDEYGICKDAFARTADGEACSTLDPQAASFCALGAMSRAVRELTIDTGINTVVYNDALTMIAELVGVDDPSLIGNWNDEASDEDIRNVFATAARMNVEATT